MIQFTTPLVLLALPALAAAFWLIHNRGRHALRFVALVLVVLATADPLIARREVEQNVLLLVDRSASVATEASDAETQALIDRIVAQHDTWRFAVIEFASDAFVSAPFGSHPVLAGALPFDDTRTLLRPAIDLAVASFPPGGAHQIVLVGDGRASDDLDEALHAAQSAGAPISVVPIGTRAVDDVSLTALRAPSDVPVGQSFELEIELDTADAGPATVAVYRDEVLLSVQELMLEPGRTTTSVHDDASTAGTSAYRALVKRPGDPIPENDGLSALVRTTERPRLLVVDPALESSALPRLLDSLGVPYEPADGIPPFEVLAEYRQIILSGIPLSSLAARDVAGLEAFVRDLGGGLLIVQGEREATGFSGGGIADLLPVSYTLPEKGQEASLAIVFLLDRSASMHAKGGGLRKIDILKESAAASIALLTPETLVGIVAFNLDHEWVFPIDAIGDGASAYDSLRPLDAIGGTDIYYPIVAALDALEATEARSKHLLLVSDGKTTDEVRDYPGLIRRLQGLEDVTLTAIAVGQVPNLPLLRTLVDAGGGDLYLASNFETLPQVSIQATQRISRSRFVTSPTEVAGRLETLLATASTAIPPVGGYVVTYPKATTQVLLWADEDPLVAHWRSGLGTVTVLNTDLAGIWTVDWLTWPDASTLFDAILATTEPTAMESAGLSLAVSQTGDTIDVLVDARDGAAFESFLDLESLLLPLGELRSLRQVGPGAYRASYHAPPEGGYAIHVTDRDSDRSVSDSFTIGYPAEYAATGPDLDALSHIADATGGRVLDDDLALTPGTRGETTRSRSLHRELLIAGLILFLLDLGLRKLPGRIAARTTSR